MNLLNSQDRHHEASPNNGQGLDREANSSLIKHANKTMNTQIDVTEKFIINGEYGGCRVADVIDQFSPPADALEFPTPSLFLCRQVNVLAKDHRTGQNHLVKALVKTEQSSYTCSNGNGDCAYFLKQLVSRTGDGCAKIWAAVVLKAVKSRHQNKGTTERSLPLFDLDWESTEKMVAIRVYSWQFLDRQKKQKIVQVGTSSIAR
jgi:hypothetical protein